MRGVRRQRLRRRNVSRSNPQSLIPNPPGVRRLIPARDDALPLYIKEQGATLGKSGDELTVKSRQEVLQRAKLIDTSQVSLFGNVQVTAQALRELAADGIPVCHFSYGGWFHAVTVGMVHKNVELRIAQFAVGRRPGPVAGPRPAIRGRQDQELPHAASPAPGRRAGRGRCSVNWPG